MQRVDLEKDFKALPISPGVYFHKDKKGHIIYIGKAAVLRNRVRQYFQNSRDMDVKTKALVSEIAEVDWLETESEIDALFLEAEMVKRYMPRYNILLRDDKSLLYVRIDMKSEWPHISFTRHPADDKAEYYGPYYNGAAIRKALRYLRRVFPYYTKPNKTAEGKKMDLDAHLGLSPVGMSSNEYKSNLRKLTSYLKGDRKKLARDLEKEMKSAAKKHDFEKAAQLRNKLVCMNELQRRIMFGDKEFLDISKDAALCDLCELLNLTKTPIRIEGFDISHTGGREVVASQVVFKNGTSDRSQYRKYKTRFDQNNDFYNMGETISRRLSDKNLKNWGKPDFVLIDGGKGQLDAALQVRDKYKLTDIPFVGLAKKEEQIVVKDLTINQQKLNELDGYLVSTDNFTLINLPKTSHIIKLFQRIRDEAHRFAVSYHTTLKRGKQTTSSLDDIPGIGPKTRSKLIRKFGSVRGLKNASQEDLQEVVGVAKAEILANYFKVI